MKLTRVTITGSDGAVEPSDLIGNRVGMLAVVAFAGRRGPRQTQYWDCLCDCGATTSVKRSSLVGKYAVDSKRSCGCMRGRYPRTPRLLAERFWEHVERRGDQECWPWTASTNPKGYGQFNVGHSAATGHCQLTHRVSYELEIGVVPAGLFVLHSCDNPPCCNPAHLFLGTNDDNMRDKCLKGRGRGSLSRAEVVELKRLAADGAEPEALSLMFEIMPYSVVQILKGRTWHRVA